MRGEKGFALILTLIVTALMVAALVELIHQTYVDISLSRGYRDGQQASLLAESGAIGAMKMLRLSIPEAKKFTSLTDAWAKPVKLDDETGSLEITVTEESARLCINDLYQDPVKNETELNTPAAVKRLGNRLQIPEDAWNALADWIDSNDQTRSSNSAETPYYKAQKPPYAARNDKLATIAELSLVKGFTPAHIAALRPFVTVHSPGGTLSPVNINTAPKEVLMALDEGIDERMAERILEERRLKPFENLGDLPSRVPGAETIASRLGLTAKVKGSLFRITSIAKVKETFRTVEVVIRLPDVGEPETLSWQEY